MIQGGRETPSRVFLLTILIFYDVGVVWELGFVNHFFSGEITMGEGVFGPYVLPTDTVQCPRCNVRQKIDQLLRRQEGISPPYYVCQCSPKAVIIADAGDGNLQLFSELAHCLVASTDL